MCQLTVRLASKWDFNSIKMVLDSIVLTCAAFAHHVHDLLCVLLLIMRFHVLGAMSSS